MYLEYKVILHVCCSANKTNGGLEHIPKPNYNSRKIEIKINETCFLLEYHVYANLINKKSNNISSHYNFIR